MRAFSLRVCATLMMLLLASSSSPSPKKEATPPLFLAAPMKKKTTATKKRVCRHGRLLSNGCRVCTPGMFCVHSRRRAVCGECRGTRVCAHGRRRDHCRECTPHAFCAHARRVDLCLVCSPGRFCVHGVLDRCARCRRLAASGGTLTARMALEAGIEREVRRRHVLQGQPGVPAAFRNKNSSLLTRDRDLLRGALALWEFSLDAHADAPLVFSADAAGICFE